MTSFVSGFGQGGINLCSSGVPTPYLSQFLSTNGDGTGDVQGTGNYSATATSFFISPTEEQRVLDVTRLIVQISDTGSVDAGFYGNGITLTNGININAIQDGVTTNLTQIPIKTNGDWATYSYDVQSTSFGAGLNYVSVRWTFAKGGTVIRLNRRNNDRLEVVLNDNFTGLVGHTFIVQGNIPS